MAQTESSGDEAYGEFGKILSAETAIASGKFKSIGLLETACTANTSQNFAGVTGNISTKSGLGVVDGTITAETTTETDDTVQVDKTMTAGEAATIKGAVMMPDTDNKVYLIVCYAADVVLATSDTLQNTLQIQWKAD